MFMNLLTISTAFTSLLENFVIATSNSALNLKGTTDMPPAALAVAVIPCHIIIAPNNESGSKWDPRRKHIWTVHTYFFFQKLFLLGHNGLKLLHAAAFQCVCKIGKGQIRLIEMGKNYCLIVAWGTIVFRLPCRYNNTLPRRNCFLTSSSNRRGMMHRACESGPGPFQCFGIRMSVYIRA